MSYRMVAGMTAFMVIILSGIVWALNDTYNRPCPLMDYVPQEIGMFDTRYENLAADDCRGCHGDSLADRHHCTSMVLEDRLCAPCHDLAPVSPYLVIITDCTTGGCHSWDDLDGPNGWHHNTDLSASGNCVQCHNPNLVGPIGPFLPFQNYPPSVVTPTPFSCENCHWRQDLVDAPGFDPATEPSSEAGQPSTYHHYDSDGDFVGYHEYGLPIADNFDTHHMGFKGGVAMQCHRCHSQDPNSETWDPANPELIRYCEICHDTGTLHNFKSHVGPFGSTDPMAVNGWVAIGFHAGGGGDKPSAYRPFRGDEMCLGCHCDDPEAPDLVCSPTIRVKPQGITPSAAGPEHDVELFGECFGEAYDPGRRRVEVKKRPDGAQWNEMEIQSWSDDRIVFRIPPLAVLAEGNYSVRVHNEDGATPDSNQAGLTVVDGCLQDYCIPDHGPCRTKVSLGNGCGGFGTSRDTISGPGGTNGIYRVIQMTSSQGSYLALNINSWGSYYVTFTVEDFFQDQDGDFIQDSDEGAIAICDGMAPDLWTIDVRSIYYSDDDVTGNYTQGDSISRVESLRPMLFVLTDAPYISKLGAKSLASGRRLKITGVNFGSTEEGGEVRVGLRADAESALLGLGKPQDVVKSWSDSKIVVKLKVPAKWQGKTRFVWVEKNRKKSNAKRLQILPPQR
jgi:hypothetical protein